MNYYLLQPTFLTRVGFSGDGFVTHSGDGASREPEQPQTIIRFRGPREGPSGRSPLGLLNLDDDPSSSRPQPDAPPPHGLVA